MLAQDGGKIAGGALDESDSQTSVAVSSGSAQTKPEYFRKESAYQNMSKIGGWGRGQG